MNLLNLDVISLVTSLSKTTMKIIDVFQEHHGVKVVL